MCENQGDWRFYFHYKKWQQKTYAIALDIIATNHIDVVHQLNMVGFREPGYLWKITDIPFVWGPVGGMENIPLQYIRNSGLKRILFSILRGNINNWQIKKHRRVKKAIERSDALIAATGKSIEKIGKYHNRKAILINETACYADNENQIGLPYTNSDVFNIVWVGRFIYRKQLDLALKTIAKVKDLKGIKFHIVGGYEHEEKRYRKLTAMMDMENICVWHGCVPNKEVHSLMRQMDLFFFTSILDTTSTVILEAISNQLPILCFNTCGFGPIVDDSIGRTIELTNPKQSVDDFAEKIRFFHRHRDILRELSANCIHKARELSWDNKAQQMIVLYHQAINNLKQT
jgi:glycosyltransferase involved in cell wall biosynthesis